MAGNQSAPEKEYEVGRETLQGRMSQKPSKAELLSREGVSSSKNSKEIQQGQY